jgi:hypothetical protein
MSRPRSAKIFIETHDGLCDFMWANIAPDGSIMVGFLYDVKEQVELIRDPQIGELHNTDLITSESVQQPKVTFHSAGHYKLPASMGLSEDSLDRATVKGLRLKDIVEPRRMLEILIPRTLRVTTSAFTEQDIRLDARHSTQRPLRCTVSCMAVDKYLEIFHSGQHFVDTSEWEVSDALADNSKAWVWTLRHSKNDTFASDRFFLFLCGPVKWVT